MTLKEDFAPYLPEIIPQLLNMSALKPKIGVTGETGDILQFLSEVSSLSKDGLKTNEIEDKNVAI